MSSEMTETDSDGLWRCPECDAFVEVEDPAVEKILALGPVDSVRVSEGSVRVFTDLERGSDEVLDLLVKAKALAGDRDVSHQRSQ